MENKNDLKILDDCEDAVRRVLEAIQDRAEWKYTLNQQIFKSCYSIGSNIAESTGRVGKDGLHHLDIAVGSLNECVFQARFYDKLHNDSFYQLLFKIRATCFKLKKRKRERLAGAGAGAVK